MQLNIAIWLVTEMQNAADMADLCYSFQGGADFYTMHPTQIGTRTVSTMLSSVTSVLFNIGPSTSRIVEFHSNIMINLLRVFNPC